MLALGADGFGRAGSVCSLGFAKGGSSLGGMVANGGVDADPAGVLF